MKTPEQVQEMIDTLDTQTGMAIAAGDSRGVQMYMNLAQVLDWVLNDDEEEVNVGA